MAVCVAPVRVREPLVRFVYFCVRISQQTFSRCGMQHWNANTKSTLATPGHHPWLLDRIHRDAGVANLGSVERALPLLARLRRGVNVTVAAIGGSVTAGHGATVDPTQEFPSHGAGRKNRGWARMFFESMERHWPPSQGGAHVFANGAIPAVPPPYFLMCMHDCVPSRVDLLFVELAMNSDGRRRNHAGAVEQIVRRALRWPGRPVVILIDWIDRWHYPTIQGVASRQAVPNATFWPQLHVLPLTNRPSGARALHCQPLPCDS